MAASVVARRLRGRSHANRGARPADGRGPGVRGGRRDQPSDRRRRVGSAPQRVRADPHHRPDRRGPQGTSPSPHPPPPSPARRKQDAPRAPPYRHPRADPPRHRPHHEADQARQGHRPSEPAPAPRPRHPHRPCSIGTTRREAPEAGDGPPYIVDFLWPDADLVVETDGYRDHGTRGAFTSDRRRDVDLFVAYGLQTLRFTWDDITDDAAVTAAKLTAARRRARDPGTAGTTSTPARPRGGRR